MVKNGIIFYKETHMSTGASANVKCVDDDWKKEVVGTL